MTSITDLCNRALAEMGARAVIASLDEASTEAVNCSLFYNPLRKQLLRAAAWGFARETAPLTLLGSVLDTPSTSVYPWAYKYLLPARSLKLRYLLPPPPNSQNIPGVPQVGEPLAYSPWYMPSRGARFLVSTEQVTTNGVTVSQNIVLSNVEGAYAVYTADIDNPDQFDNLFAEALVQLLANKLVIPLSGNIKMKQGFLQFAKEAVINARLADGNEASPSTDHTPDWMQVRGNWDPFAGLTTAGFIGGAWFSPYDEMSWGD